MYLQTNFTLLLALKPERITSIKTKPLLINAAVLLLTPKNISDLVKKNISTLSIVLLNNNLYTYAKKEQIF